MENNSSALTPDAKSPVPEPSRSASPPATPDVKASHVHNFIFGYLALIVLIAVVAGVYTWQHKKVNDSVAKVASLQTQLSSLHAQVNKLSAKTTTSLSTTNSILYSGWKSYTLKYEKSSFKYPATWQVSDTSSGGQDMVALDAPDGFYLNIDTVNLGHPNLDYPTTVIYSIPLTFLAQSGYINYYSGSTSSTDSVINAELSTNSTDVFSSLFPTKNLNPSGNYSISLGDKTIPLTLSGIKTDANADNSDTKLILESVIY